MLWSLSPSFRLDVSLGPKLRAGKTGSLRWGAGYEGNIPVWDLGEGLRKVSGSWMRAGVGGGILHVLGTDPRPLGSSLLLLSQRLQ